MTVPWQPARHGRGLLLVRGRPDVVAGWARRGLVPVHVAPLEGWTAVVPAGPSHAVPPYDDAVTCLAGRPVGGRLRTAVGVFAVGGRGVLTVHPHGWRAVQRWFVWQPGRGLVRAPRLAPGRPGDLVAAAGLADPRLSREAMKVLRDPGGDALSVLTDVLAVLDLPGAGLLRGDTEAADLDGSLLVEPGPGHVARFDAMTQDEARMRAELEDLG